MIIIRDGNQISAVPKQYEDKLREIAEFCEQPFTEFVIEMLKVVIEANESVLVLAIEEESEEEKPLIRNSRTAAKNLGGVLTNDQKDEFIPEDSNGKHPQDTQLPSINNPKKYDF